MRKVFGGVSRMTHSQFTTPLYWGQYCFLKPIHIILCDRSVTVLLKMGADVFSFLLITVKCLIHCTLRTGIYINNTRNFNKQLQLNKHLNIQASPSLISLSVLFLLTFSSTLQTYWHQRMRKMMMTNSRMMVTRQPIRMGVFPSSGG